MKPAKHKRATAVKAELRATEAHAQAVLDMAVDAIITIDQAGLIQSFNRAAERIFGYGGTEVLGQNIAILMPEPFRAEHDRYMRRYLATGERRIIGIGREVTGKRKNGTLFPMELAVSEIKLDGIHHFTGIIRDLSERKLAEERLRQREEELRQSRERLANVARLATMGEMATGIAHEINQPLTAITTYARACHRLLSMGKGEPQELLTTLDKISAQAQRAGEIIQRLRAFVKKRDTHREACELNALVRYTLVLAETDIRAHGLRIETRLAPLALPVTVDPVQIQQVLLNLIRNAIEAIQEVKRKESGMIIISTEVSAGECARIAVSDQGVGLAPGTKDKLFTPFFTTKASGTGMGLSISRSIVAAHGGHMGISENPGGGVTVYFTLPFAVADHA
ncbi:MAG: PAS domain S-box protein [Gammaproteobacteria bacterium]